MNELFDRCRWCGETRASASKPHSSPVETTEADSGTTSYTGVIRGANEARMRGYILEMLAERDAAIGRLWDVIDANGDTNARLMRERDETRTERDEALANLDDAEARCQRLWRQLEEATNVPDAPTSYREAVQRCGGVQAADDRRAL